MKLKSFALLIAVSFGFGNLGQAQIPDLRNQTLDFVNVTTTNLNQSVDENINLNEKSIDFADFDNDGDYDVAIGVVRSDFGQRQNKLYRNDDGVLNEVSGTPVIPGFSLTDVARSIFFQDFDLDGFADIVVVCTSNSGTSTVESPGRTKYFRNIQGTHFVNETERLSFLTGAASAGATADFDENGFPDLVLINEPNISQDSYALNNINGNGPGQFQIVTSTNYPAESFYGDNGEAADMNGDGLVDLLIANSSSSPAFIYYNNNQGMGSGPGDFSYESPGSYSSFSGVVGGLNERVLYPADFNNDGLMDFYFSDRIIKNDQLFDFVMMNVGNDEFNRAQFEPVAMPDSTSTETMKVRSSDLDQDGREDLIVMSEFRRPQIFRNTSENGEIRFLEWTPRDFNSSHSGWMANSTDLLGDKRPDILVGALTNDHLFENKLSDEFELVDLIENRLPAEVANQPVSVVGEIGLSATIVISSDEITAGTSISVLLRSFGELNLIARQFGSVIAESDVVGHGSDEALQFSVPATGEITIEVSSNGISLDGNNDGVVNLLDVGPFVNCLSGNSDDCDPFDLDDSGSISLLLIAPFVSAVIEEKTSDLFVLEVLIRDN